jgi:hypothetical protein
MASEDLPARCLKYCRNMSDFTGSMPLTSYSVEAILPRGVDGRGHG